MSKCVLVLLLLVGLLIAVGCVSGSYPRNCEYCQGTGWIQGQRSQACPYCRGSGHMNPADYGGMDE